MNDKVHTNWEILSDKSIIETIGNYIQSNRLKQNKTQDHVAKDAGLSRSTMSLLERGEKIRIESLIRVFRVLKLLYVMDVFTIKEQISPIEYAKI